MPKPTRGHQIRLTEDQKAEIRNQYRNGVPYSQIVDRFGCSLSNFWLIVRGLRQELHQKQYGAASENLADLAQVKLGWVAGILDGEGYIGLVPTKAAVNERGFGITPRIDVVSTTLRMQEELARILGCGAVYEKKNRRPREKPQFSWSIWSTQTVGPVLRAVLPHLVVKQKVASVVLSFCERRLLEGGQPYSEVDLRAIDKVRRLNSKGNLVEGLGPCSLRQGKQEEFRDG